MCNLVARLVLFLPRLREECNLRVFENRMLRRIFGPKRDDITNEWRKIHNEDLDDLYSLLNIIRVIKLRELDGRS